MNEGNAAMTIRVIGHIAEVAAAQWDACAGGQPFVRHAFLSALEESGSACAESGWAPRHLIAEDGSGRVVACAPLYLKSHSYGEYVFDWGWADAYQRAGGRYYPKLQCAVPFTPVTGPRLMVRPGADAPALRRALLAAMLELARRAKVSSLHITFPTAAEWRDLQGEDGMLARLGQQYHWINQGYDSFDDFLGALSSRKRKAIRKERERAGSLGLDIRPLTGRDITPAHWDAFYDFYLDTIDRKWAHAYLTRDFFHRLGASMADHVVLLWATAAGRPVAGALNLHGDDALYGRLWGAVGEFRFLHFELCYYRAIDYAIAHRIPRVEAGAQGEHKVQRGYLPHPTHSLHWIAEPRFRAAIAHFLDHERAAIAEDMAELCQSSPFRQS